VRGEGARKGTCLTRGQMPSRVLSRPGALRVLASRFPRTVPFLLLSLSSPTLHMHSPR
jgi:hypothetical protein